VSLLSRPSYTGSMRVFVTGGTGYFGSWIVRTLLNQGDSVTVLARDLSRVLPSTNLTVVEGDLRDPPLLEQAFSGHDVCIHNGLIWGDDERMLPDTRASIAVFEAAAGAGIGHVVYTSSTAVHRPFEPMMSEQSRLHTNDLYGATKACNEVFLSATSHQTRLAYTIVRPGPIVGAPVEGAPHKSDRRFVEYIRTARTGEPIRVASGDGRQFVSVVELARFYAALVRSDPARETYIAVSPSLVTWEWIAREVVAAVGCGTVLVEDEVTPPRFDVSKIQRDFGLTFDAESALKEHIRYLVATLEE